MSTYVHRCIICRNSSDSESPRSRTILISLGDIHISANSSATHLGRGPAVVLPYSSGCTSIPGPPAAPRSRVPRRFSGLDAASAPDPFAILAERSARYSHAAYDDSKKKSEIRWGIWGEVGGDSKHQRYLFAFKT